MIIKLLVTSAITEMMRMAMSKIYLNQTVFAVVEGLAM